MAVNGIIITLGFVCLIILTKSNDCIIQSSCWLFTKKDHQCHIANILYLHGSLFSQSIVCPRMENHDNLI